MENLKFNEPQFLLHCINLPDDALRIVSFEGSEQISGLYEYRFRLLSEDPSLDTKDILNCNASFILNRGDEEPQKINGIISNFKQLGRTPDYVSYQAVLVPRMWRLLLNKQSKVFQNMNIEDFISKVLTDAGFSSSDFDFKLEKTYPAKEFVVQYQETDLNFINRRLEHLGIFFFIDQRGENDVTVFCDSNDNVLPIEVNEDITFNPNKDPFSVQETISELVHDESVVTGQVRLKDYNYEFPSKQLLVESQLDKKAPGTQYTYGDHFKDENEGEFLARIRNEEIVCKSSIFTGKGDCRLFRAGYKFQMGKHYREDWNSEFLLTKVISRGTQRGLFAILPPSEKVEPTYQNAFEAISQSLAYRPPRTSSQPKIYGVMNAKVDAAGKGEHAEIDEQGRYKVILPFDLSGSKEGEASCYIRMIQPYAGPDYGFHFPLHKGTEVLLTFIDGNPDRPVISGAVPNPETISPVTNANQTKSVMRDNFGNEIIMDATPGDEHIRLHSPHHKSSLEIGRSIKAATENEDAAYIGGNSIEGCIGNKLEAFLGNNVEIKAGIAAEAFFGGSLEVEVAGKLALLYGPDCSFHWGPKYEYHWGDTLERSEDNINSLADKNNILTAGDTLNLVGGADKENTSILEVNEQNLTLSFGVNKNPRRTKKISPEVRAKADKLEEKGFTAATATAFCAALSLIFFMMYDISADKGAKVVGQILGHLLTIAEGILVTMSVVYWTMSNQLQRADESIVTVNHCDTKDETPQSVIDLRRNEGIFMGIEPTTKVVGKFDKTSAKSKIEMDNQGNILINSKDKKISVGIGTKDKEDSEITLDNEKVLLSSGKGKSEIVLDKNGNVTIYADGNIEFAKCGEIKFHNFVKLDKGALEFKGTKKLKTSCFEAG